MKEEGKKRDREGKSFYGKQRKGENERTRFSWRVREGGIQGGG